MKVINRNSKSPNGPVGTGPREKEVSIRRRLRKQQNDTDAFEKLHTIQKEFAHARGLVDMVVQREKVKLDWVKSRFELIQAELEANPTLYYVIHGRPYVPPRIVLNKVRLHDHGHSFPTIWSS